MTEGTVGDNRERDGHNSSGDSRAKDMAGPSQLEQMGERSKSPFSPAFSL